MIRNTNLPCLVVHLLYAVQTGDHTHPKTHLLPWGTQTWPQQGTLAPPQTGKYFESLITKSPVSHNKSPYLKLALSIPHLCHVDAFHIIWKMEREQSLHNAEYNSNLNSFMSLGFTRYKQNLCEFSAFSTVGQSHSCPSWYVFCSYQNFWKITFYLTY